MPKRRKQLTFHHDHPLVAWGRARWAGVLAGPAGTYVKPLVERLRRLGVLGSVTRFVLNLGDEGVTLVQLSGHQAVDALFIGPEAEDGLATLRTHLMADTRATIIVLADVLEQMYREEQLPKVSRLDRGNVFKRRLDVAFPHDSLKAALPLAVKKGFPASALFAALPETESIGHWIKFLEELPHPVVGFCLLPLESYGMAEHLAPTAAGEERRIWRALVSQQATSGFRQIFESEGKLVVTRLTQRPPGDLTPDSVAQLIERELRSSISYIKRLGYSDADRLDLVVLADPAVCEAAQTRDLPVTSVSAYTPHQAGLLLGVGNVGPEGGSYADVLHAQWLAYKRRPLATLPTPVLRERLILDSLFKGGFAAAAFLSVVAILVCVSLAFDAFDTTTTGELLTRQLETQRQGLEQARAKIQSFEVPVEDLALADQTETRLAKYSTDPTALLGILSSVLDAGVLVQSISFETPALMPVDSATAAAPPPAPRLGLHGIIAKPAETLFEMSVKVLFVADTGDNADAALQHAKDFLERLSKAFQGYEVSAKALPLIAAHAKIIEGTAGRTNTAAPLGPPTAEYVIRKRV